MRLHINQKVVAVLKDALAHCNMNDACDRDAPGSCGIDSVHREAMRIYLESWVAAQLRLAINAIEGGPDGENYLRAISVRNLIEARPAWLDTLPR